MNAIVKKAFSSVLICAYVLVCGEISIRVISSFVMVYGIEMLDYAKEQKVKSDVPGISHQHRTNAKAKLMGVEVALNSLGHRSAELKNPKPKDERRIYFLGSSITLGWGVPADKVYVSLVEQRLNAEVSPRTGHRYTAINAGIGNYNSYYAVALFKRQVDLTQPDVAVIQYYINDAEPNPRGEDSVILKYSLFAAFVYQHLKTISVVARTSLADHYRALYVDGLPDWERAKAAIRELKADCDKRNIRLVALLVPEMHDFSKDGPFPPIYEKIGKAFQDVGVHMVNPLPRFQTEFGRNPASVWAAADDPHPNAAAHKVIADALYEYLAPRIE